MKVQILLLIRHFVPTFFYTCFTKHGAHAGEPCWKSFLSKQHNHCHQQRLTAIVDLALPPLSAQWAYLICYKALLLKEWGMRNVPQLRQLPKHRSPTGSSHLHQTAGEIQRETQALHCVCMLLLHSDRERRKERCVSGTPQCDSAFSLHWWKQHKH